MNEDNKTTRPQDEIPFEVRMKHLIEAYRKDIKRLEDLTRYAKGLEEENTLLQKTIKEYEGEMSEAKEKEDVFKAMSIKIKNLQGKLTKDFPKRVVKVAVLNQLIKNQKEYIKELQGILESNGISYPEMEQDPLTIEKNYDIEHLDIFAVRGENENYDNEIESK